MKLISCFVDLYKVIKHCGVHNSVICGTGNTGICKCSVCYIGRIHIEYGTFRSFVKRVCACREVAYVFLSMRSVVVNQLDAVPSDIFSDIFIPENRTRHCAVIENCLSCESLGIAHKSADVIAVSEDCSCHRAAVEGHTLGVLCLIDESGKSHLAVGKYVHIGKCRIRVVCGVIGKDIGECSCSECAHSVTERIEVPYVYIGKIALRNRSDYSEIVYCREVHKSKVAAGRSGSVKASFE